MIQNNPKIISRITMLSILALNLNRINAQIKWHRVVEWIKKKLDICCLQETHLRSKNTQTENLRMKKFISCRQKLKNPEHQ